MRQQRQQDHFGYDQQVPPESNTCMAKLLVVAHKMNDGQQSHAVNRDRSQDRGHGNDQRHKDRYASHSSHVVLLAATFTPSVAIANAAFSRSIQPSPRQIVSFTFFFEARQKY